jgi:hypothetical protein
MATNPVSVMLNEEALLELQEVLLDDDAEGALAFVKRHVAPCVPRSSSRPCDSTRLNPFVLKRNQGERP